MIFRNTITYLLTSLSLFPSQKLVKSGEGMLKGLGDRQIGYPEICTVSDFMMQKICCVVYLAIRVSRNEEGLTVKCVLYNSTRTIKV